MNNDDKCPICWGDIGNEKVYGKVEPCLHKFCMKCIQNWTESSKTCPVCRETIITINGSQLETSGIGGITRDVIGQGQVDVSTRCEGQLCHKPLESFGRLECLYCSKRLDRCEGCTEALLTNDEEAWSCPNCGRSTPIPSTGGSSFTIKESPYALYHFDDPRATSTNSKDNPSSSISSNETITYHQDSNLMDRIMEDMNKTHNTPGLTTSTSNEKKLNPGQLEEIEMMVKAVLDPHYKNQSITTQEYRRRFNKNVPKKLNPGQLEEIKMMLEATLDPHYKTQSITTQEYWRRFNKNVPKKLNPGQLVEIKMMVKAVLDRHYENWSITLGQYQRLFRRIVRKVIKLGKRLHPRAVEELAESYILYQKKRSNRFHEASSSETQGQ